MVTLNLTLLIELGLFLLFLWGTAQFVIRPTLRQIDERDEALARDGDQTGEATQKAEELEADYAATLSGYRHEAEEALRSAHRQASKEHLDFLAEERLRADAAVAEVRTQTLAHIEAQRPALKAESSAVAKRIREQLGHAEGTHG